jgi:hypothetical protein
MTAWPDVTPALESAEYLGIVDQAYTSYTV